MRHFEFSLALSAEKLRQIYAGEKRSLLVESADGQKLQLPAWNFRGFVSKQGLFGHFSVDIDDDNRIIELRRL